MTSAPMVIKVLYIRAETHVNASERSDDTRTATYYPPVRSRSRHQGLEAPAAR
jgi:hypothetical protein